MYKLICIKTFVVDCANEDLPIHINKESIWEIIDIDEDGYRTLESKELNLQLTVGEERYKNFIPLVH